MGYLIGGAGEEAQAEIVQSDRDLSTLSNEDLLALHAQTVRDLSLIHI